MSKSILSREIEVLSRVVKDMQKRHIQEAHLLTMLEVNLKALSEQAQEIENNTIKPEQANA